MGKFDKFMAGAAMIAAATGVFGTRETGGKPEEKAAETSTATAGERGEKPKDVVDAGFREEQIEVEAVNDRIARINAIDLENSHDVSSVVNSLISDLNYFKQQESKGNIKIQEAAKNGVVFATDKLGSVWMNVGKWGNTPEAGDIVKVLLTVHPVEGWADAHAAVTLHRDVLKPLLDAAVSEKAQ